MLRLIALETRLLLREPIALLLLAVLATASILAFVNGRALIDSQMAGRAVSLAEDKKAEDSFAKRFETPLPPAEAILGPYRVRLGINAPLPLLVDFSAGRAAFDNYSTQVTLRARADTLFKRTQTDNPELLMRGSFDLGFVVIVLVPLMLIGLGYGLFTADRDSGAARLVLVQSGSPLRVLAARSVPRLTLIAIPILGATLALLAYGPVLTGRNAAAISWFGIALLVMGAWWAVILFINSLRISAETAALALVSAWTLTTLVMPSAISALAQAAYPPPSRFEQIVAARAAEVGATTSYENDHPDLASEDVAGRLASIRKTFAISKDVEAAVTPLNARFDAQLERQQSVVRALAWLSPPLVAAGALNDTAQTGDAVAIGFRKATTDYLARFRASVGGYVERGEVIDKAGFAAVPRFNWQAPAPALSDYLLYLIMLVAGLGFIAIRRLARAKPD
jgi:ABC-2 type transport system permease protein